MYMNKISHNSFKWLKNVDDKELEIEYNYWTAEMRPCS